MYVERWILYFGVIYILLTLIYVVHVIRREVNSEESLESQDKRYGLRDYYLQFHQRERTLKNVVIPPGQYAVEYCDCDQGTIMSGVPDPSPKVFATFPDVIRHIKNYNNDQMKFTVFDSNRDLICGGEVTPTLFDLDAICGMKPDDWEKIDRELASYASRSGAK